jgi:hypothetical protein
MHHPGDTPDTLPAQSRKKDPHERIVGRLRRSTTGSGDPLAPSPTPSPAPFTEPPGRASCGRAAPGARRPGVESLNSAARHRHRPVAHP